MRVLDERRRRRAPRSRPGASTASSASTSSAWLARRRGPRAGSRRAPPPPSPRRVAPLALAQPERARHLVGLRRQDAGRDQQLRRRARSATVTQQRAREVGDDRGRPRRGVAREVDPARRVTATPLRRGVGRDRRERAGVDLDRGHRLPAEPRRGDRQHAGARAPVAQRAARLDLLQQLQAQPRGRVRAGAEVRRRDRSPGRRRRRRSTVAGRRSPPTRTGVRNSCQRRSQPAGTGSVTTSSNASPTSAAICVAARQLAGRRVQRVLDRIADRALLGAAPRAAAAGCASATSARSARTRIPRRTRRGFNRPGRA